MPGYAKLVLMKKNIDHSRALSIVSRVLGVSSKFIGFAGIKDKRGITYQFITVPRKSILGLNKTNSSQIFLEYYEACEKELRIGELKGNNFNIIIRNVAKNSDVDKLINSFSTKGFINYFGSQRFGSFSIKSHLIGYLLLLKKYKLAFFLNILASILINKYNQKFDELKSVDECIKKFAHDIDFVVERVMDFSSNDSDTLNETLFELIEQLEQKLDEFFSKSNFKNYTVEATYQKALKFYLTNPNNVQGALQHLPAKLLTLYYHAFQSFIWNYLASYRLKKFDNNIVQIGDFVIQSKDDLQVEFSAEQSIELLTEVVSEHQIKLFSFDKIVIPLIGPNIKISSNLLEYLNKIFNRLFRMNYNEFSFASYLVFSLGSYRYLTLIPRNITYEIYDNVRLPLISYDFQKICKTDYSTDNYSTLECFTFLENTSAVKVCCDLPKGSYMTCALREIMIID
ncbi:uncharacterized protein LOC142598053 [Dermatophagoides farinae]|uniref:uncharacterized protein LOC142598053 n=1 Tax=Dermatophagoides farinae TaxID=6954 RepID=UPI003F5F07CD